MGVVRESSHIEYDRYRFIPIALKIHREAKRLTQSAVAKFLGFKDKTWISHWENGDALPNLVSAMRLSLVYNISLDILFLDLLSSIQKEMQVKGR